MKTIFIKPAEIERKWFVVDAQGQTLGRIATRVATILRGKHRPYYTPHQEVGDFVIVVNAEKVHVTGNKLKDKMYYRHSGYPGGLYVDNLAGLLKRKPISPIEKAIKGMLPKGPLGRQLFRNLKVYEGSSHPHVAQNPETISLGGLV